jgi:Arc/MetJ-type ribon-helix-helix transcriptional regulator
MKKKKKKSPSRIRYEAKRPVFSFRINKELNDRVQQVKKTEGKSNADIVRAGVRQYEVKIRAEEEIRDEAREQGINEGYECAKEEFSVSYRCSVCGKEIVVSSEEERKAIRAYMHEAGWGHAGCVNRS